MEDQKIYVVGAALGVGGNVLGCEQAPSVLQNSAFLQPFKNKLQWEEIFTAAGDATKLIALPAIAAFNQELAQKILQLVRAQKKFLVLGGEHSCAVGTWSGAAAAKQKEGPIGLVWLDAHMDSHTPESSHTKNIHGMPLAALMGYGAKELTHILSTQPKLLPQYVCVVGVRSFETEEMELLQKLNVQIDFMPEVEKDGIEKVFQAALKRVKNNTVGYGISLDIDMIDPLMAPGVGVPVANGVNAQQLCVALKKCQNDPQLLGVEIVEFNPKLDKEQITEKLVAEIIKALF